MNSRSRRRRSASPRSIASRSSLRTALNTTDRVTVVTVLAAQHGGVLTAAGGLNGQERAELDSGPADVVHHAGRAWAARRLQQLGDAVPDKIPQPALLDAGQVDVAAAVREPHPEVVGLQKPGLFGLSR